MKDTRIVSGPPITSIEISCQSGAHLRIVLGQRALQQSIHVPRDATILDEFNRGTTHHRILIDKSPLHLVPPLVHHHQCSSDDKEGSTSCDTNDLDGIQHQDNFS